MSRTNKIIKNAKVGTFFFILVSVIGFYSRKIFLERLGDEFIGLLSTLQSFLSFLNLVELGVGSAMGFAMYKSLFDKNHERLNELFTLIGYLYNKIGKIVFIAGFVLSLFFPLIFSKTPINILVIYYVFYIYLFSSLIYYFFNYHLMVMQADQKGYIPTSYQQSLHIIKILLQIGVLHLTSSFSIFISIELLSTIVLNILLHRRIKKEYPWLNFSSKGDKTLITKNKELITKIKQVFVHRISGFILKSTDNIVIFSFVSLQSVTYVNNYYLIIGSSTSLLTNFFTGTKAAVGSVISENNSKKINNTFWELTSLNHFVGGILVMSLYYGVNPVISLWLGEQYIMEDTIVLLLLANVMISKMRVSVEQYIHAYGMFQDIWAPITEGVLNLVISIILASHFGISGVLLGTFVSVSLIVLIWKPYFLYKNGFKKPLLSYWIGFFKLLLSFTLAAILANYLISNFILISEDSWIILLISLIQVGAILLIVYSAIMYLFNPGFRTLALRIINIFKNIIKS
ncbi:sugar transporter [Algibacter amylolyticus]|uniref:Sugar transporter n=1 Tax=Algibacter amylolyticus TaxID=1608400 RepID=A0A5M7B7M3_9FLAO|nr:sugar transporter [Algibacter amylolyticus]KAA5825586.1 sugar transporter [Algibacter amylolyticus]MBB5268188.1 O-antigen/teichoic acid export membrane protein [Algibacter amylolyticus]TSJ79884.1 sugar transporter [Algibacter amylolyticus]